MILVDVNLLLYATVSSFEEHGPAHEWLETKLNGPARVGLPWISLLGLVRIASNPRVLSEPPSVAHLWQRVEEWLDLPNVWTPAPGDRHRQVMSALLQRHPISSRHVTDAHLAALAIEYGLVLCSADEGFRRFDELRWENPLG